MWPTRNGEINCGKQGYCGKYRATINFPVSKRNYLQDLVGFQRRVGNFCLWLIANLFKHIQLRPPAPGCLKVVSQPSRWRSNWCFCLGRSWAVEADNRVLPPPIPNVCPLSFFVCYHPPMASFKNEPKHYYLPSFWTFSAIFRGRSFLAPRKSILASWHDWPITLILSYNLRRPS